MGALVHKFVPGTGSGYTLLLLHETGASENDLIPIGRAVGKGAALLSPRLGLPRDAAAEARELAEWAAEAIRQYQLEGTRIYALGYASGAELAAALLLLHPGMLAGAILMRGRMPVESEAQAGSLDGSAVLILAGQHDTHAPQEDTEALAKTLTSAGAAVEVHWMNEGQDLGPEDFQRAAKWMRER